MTSFWADFLASNSSWSYGLVRTEPAKNCPIAYSARQTQVYRAQACTQLLVGTVSQHMAVHLSFKNVLHLSFLKPSRLLVLLDVWVMTGTWHKALMLARPAYPQPLLAAAQSPTCRRRVANAADAGGVFTAARASSRESAHAPRPERGVHVGVVLGQAGAGATAERRKDLVGQLPHHGEHQAAIDLATHTVHPVAWRRVGSVEESAYETTFGGW